MTIKTPASNYLRGLIIAASAIGLASAAALVSSGCATTVFSQSTPADCQGPGPVTASACTTQYLLEASQKSTRPCLTLPALRETAAVNVTTVPEGTAKFDAVVVVTDRVVVVTILACADAIAPVPAIRARPRVNADFREIAQENHETTRLIALKEHKDFVITTPWSAQPVLASAQGILPL